MSRLIDADALIDEVIDRYCKECDKRRGIKNGKWKFIYEIGDAPCRACGIDDMKSELEDAPTADPDAEREERLRKFREMTNTAALNCDAIEIGLVQEGEPHGS